MQVERLKLSSRDIEKNSGVYKILANAYVKGKENNKPLTQIELINIAYDAGYRLTLNTLKKHIKEARKEKLEVSTGSEDYPGNARGPGASQAELT